MFNHKLISSVNKNSDLDTYYVTYKSNTTGNINFYDDALDSLANSTILIKGLYETKFTNFSVQNYESSYMPELQIVFDNSDILGYQPTGWFKKHVAYVSILDTYFIKYCPQDGGSNYICDMPMKDSQIPIATEMINLLHSYALSNQPVMFRIVDKDISDSTKPSWFIPDIAEHYVGFNEIVKI